MVFREAIETHRGTLKDSEEADDAAGELIDAAASHLRDAGVAFEIDPEVPAIIVSPSDETPFNELAHELATTGTTLAYAPTKLFTPSERRDQDMNVSTYARFTFEDQTVYTPHRAIADLDPNDVKLGHELVHADTYAALLGGEPSPYHAAFRGEVGRANNDCYSITIDGRPQVDELRAYSYELDRLAQELADRLGRFEEPPEALASPHFDTLYCRQSPSDLRGEGDTTEIDPLWVRMGQVLTSLAMFTSLYEFRIDDHDAGTSEIEEVSRSGRGVVLASLPPQNEDDYQLEMYLAPSRGASDPANAELLRTHYEWLRATVRAHHQLTQEIGDVYLAIGQATPDKRASLVCALPALTRRLDPSETHPELGDENAEPVKARREAFDERLEACRENRARN